jgi:multicomponent K+:H+ antiporter subunit D
MIALTRGGLRLFWTTKGRTTPRLSIVEAGPAAFLVLLSVALTAGIAPLMTYLDSAARSLHSPEIYIRVVNGTREAAR